MATTKFKNGLQGSLTEKSVIHQAENTRPQGADRVMQTLLNNGSNFAYLIIVRWLCSRREIDVQQWGPGSTVVMHGRLHWFSMKVGSKTYRKTWTN